MSVAAPTFTAVLDASAVLALLLGEPGADQVQAVLAESAMSAVNLAEVVGYFARHSDATREQTTEMLSALPLANIPLDEALAYEIGLLIRVTRSAGLIRCGARGAKDGIRRRLSE